MTDERPSEQVVEERAALLFFLDRVRDAVVRASDGLSDAQLRTPGVPSGTNLLGLLHHLTGMERHWFQYVAAGTGPAPATSLRAPDTMSHLEMVAAYREACAESDRIVSTFADLSALAVRANPGEQHPVSVRRILIHMIEETARHAGHADILREHLDGTTDS